MGIDIARISPQPEHLPEIIAAFDTVRRGGAVPMLQREWAPNGFVDGYWFGDAGIAAKHQAAINELQGA